MSRTISVYLAGKIQKAHEKPYETYWTEADQEVLRKAVAPDELLFLNPAIRTDNLADQRSIFGRDMLQVFSADAVLVDARDRRGLGVGAEMMWAKINRLPVISLSPLGSHYHKESTSVLGVEVESWVHPFIEGLSDYIAESLEEAADWLLTAMSEDAPAVKGPEWIRGAMHYYLDSQFPLDERMQKLASMSERLDRRFTSVRQTHEALSYDSV